MVITTNDFNYMLSIVLGPYAFMDVFDPAHICNHTDETGRYAYKVRSFFYKYLFLLIMKASSINQA